jgi:hypothetical protein
VYMNPRTADGGRPAMMLDVVRGPAHFSLRSD